MKKTLAFVLVAAMLLCMAPAFSLFAGEVVEIDTAEEFLAIEDNLGGSYKLTADITLTEGLSYKEESKRFSGTFDGNGKTITLDFVDTDKARSGLFCSVEGTNVTIKNLTVVGKLESNGNSTGVVIGTINGDSSVVTIENVTTNVSFKADNSNNGQGGIIGAVENNATVNMTNCVNKGDIIGEVVGGLIGGVHGGETKINITNCSNEGDITSTNYYADYRGAGGFIGKVQNGGATVTIKNSTNKGDVTAKFVVANAYVGHNNSGNYTVEGCSNTGTITSGGLVLSAETAVARDQGIWGDAAFGFNFDSGELKGSPRFHANPSLNGWKAYINGVEATDKVTVKYVMKADNPAEQEDRKVEIVASCNGLYDGYASVTIIWEDGKYSTFGTNAPTKVDTDLVNNSAATLEKFDEAAIDKDAFKAEDCTGRFLKDGQTEAHGSEGNLFDNANGKYEGWKTFGVSTVIPFKTSEAVKVGYYALGTGGDDMTFSNRQPAEWKLWASVDGETYEVIDEQSFDLPNLNNKLVAFKVNTDTAYQYFKLEIVKIAEEVGYELAAGETKYGYAQLGEIKIYKACEHTWGEPVVKDATCTKDGSSTKTCSNCGQEEVTVIKSEGHKLVDGVCSVCGHDTNKPAPTGDSVVALAVLSVVSLLGMAVISKKRG